ncbi:SigE family RNA polymerase sigma factor [Longispora albida]|uniref:SigE family RNA polymerase sigma factor n=1 Tax=Longispora albida TaxID=203523 RepID=UPI000688D638|nr:SigE family RNA polymerase sigma factor [Longispora albida]
MFRSRREVTDAAAGADFHSLYSAHYGELVAMLYALSGDLGDAQDMAQETFARAWQRWSSVVTYDDPVAWLRRVAVNLSTSRWRRKGVARRFLERSRVEHVPEMSPDRVVLVTALRTLPTGQRQALVLHYLADLPVAEIARQLGTAEGTVKSWLYRGRAALAAQLTEEAARDGV